MLPPRPPLWTRVARGVVVALVASWILSFLAVVGWQYRRTDQHGDAIVVLGAAQYAGRPSPVLRARLDHAIELYRQRAAPEIVFTGGTGVGDTTSEAAVGRRYAMMRGVPDSAIELENTGRTTSESMRSVAALLAARGKAEVILVSDPFHMLRLSILARRFGLHPHSSPTPTSRISASPSESWKYLFSESFKAPAAFLFERGN
ncbi:MAG: hypothetical protein JWO05_1865 [Gemmatimonadetes bacterium]|nr:hypothetical protein [Gemmatimonadota bacterium]